MLGPECDDAEAFVPPRFAPCRPPMGAGEEVRHRLRKVAQCLLLHHLRAVTQPVILRPGQRELSALLQVTWRAGPAGMPMGLLLDCEVPYEPGVRAVVMQHLSLSGCRCQAVTRHSNIVSVITEIAGR